MRFKYIFWYFAPFFVLASFVSAQNFDEIKAKVKEHTLSNGMKFIVLERHEAPVVSFHIYADVGSAQEVPGITGISHLLEHMAFKGTKTVGSTDYTAEADVLRRLDEVYDKITREQSEPVPDQNKLKSLQEEFEKLKDGASAFIKRGEYGDMYSEQGGSGLNAYTSNDATQYIISLPSNRLEFWMSMESERFSSGVFREFFEERNVVMEERRLGVETQPIQQLLEDFFAVSFKSHPYDHSVVGYMSDLRNITRQDVINYFNKYYGPNNLTAAVVGDVDAEEVFRLADLYFGRIPAGPKPYPLRTEEPPSRGEVHFSVEAQSQPLLLLGYHRPGVKDPDNFAFDALANILGQGRSSRLYTRLVKEEKISIASGSFNGFPGNKYPNMFAVYAFPAKDITSDVCLRSIDEEIQKVITASVTQEELDKYKRNVRKNTIDGWKSNSGIAANLTFNEVVLGDWGKAFDDVAQIEKITVQDVQRVAQKYLIRKNRTIGEIIPVENGGSL